MEIQQMFRLLAKYWRYTCQINTYIQLINCIDTFIQIQLICHIQVLSHPNQFTYLDNSEPKSMSLIHQLQQINKAKQDCIRSNHSEFILHSIIFHHQSLLLTMGSEGEIHLYRKNSNQDWSHQSLFRAFDAPIIAYDVIPYLNEWKLLVVGYNNFIKICRVVSEKYIILQEQLAIESEGPILNCLWNQKGNQIYASDAIGRMYVFSQMGEWKINVFQIGSMPVRLAVGQNNKIYSSINNEIELITVSSNENKTIHQESVLKINKQIVEIAVSKNHCGKYNTLVVLTKKSLQFYHLDGKECFKNCDFSLNSNATSVRIGWGRNYKQLCLYQCIKGLIQTSSYSRRLDGLWSLSTNQST